MNGNLERCGKQLTTEEYKNASLTRKLCNPGAIKNKKGEFLEFENFDSGWNYLLNYVKRVSEGKHLAYPKGGDTNIKEYFVIYAPPSENDSLAYAKFIASRIGKSLDTKLSDII